MVDILKKLKKELKKFKTKEKKQKYLNDIARNTRDQETLNIIKNLLKEVEEEKVKFIEEPVEEIINLDLSNAPTNIPEESEERKYRRREEISSSSRQSDLEQIAEEAPTRENTRPVVEYVLPEQFEFYDARPISESNVVTRMRRILKDKGLEISNDSTMRGAIIEEFEKYFPNMSDDTRNKYINNLIGSEFRREDYIMREELPPITVRGIIEKEVKGKEALDKKYLRRIKDELSQ